LLSESGYGHPTLEQMVETDERFILETPSPHANKPAGGPYNMIWARKTQWM